MLGGVTLLLVVASLIYWFLPTWKIRRAKLVPLSAEDAPEVVACLADLCREIGLSHPPVFVWNPLNPVSSGLAFGRLGRYYVALTGGLVTQFYTDRPAFRAMMLHELAHLRNGDVDKTYFTVAIWRAFVAAALVPFVISWPLAVSLIGKPWGDILNEGWRVLALAALVYLTRNAVLRVRETYADVRASVWDGPTGALCRVLETLPRPKGGRWRDVLRVHPDPGERRRALDDTDRLFRMGFWDAFGTGIAATIAFQNVDFLLSPSASGSSWAFLDPSPQPLVLPRQAPLRPGLALTVGVIGGMIFCVLSFIISFGLDFAGFEIFVAWMLFGQAALAALMQAGVAAVVAAWVKRLGGLHGLFAAFVAGCVMAGGALVIDLLIAGTEVILAPSFPTAFSIWFEVTIVINGGTLLALPTAWGVSALAGWVRQTAAVRSRRTAEKASITHRLLN